MKLFNKIALCFVLLLVLSVSVFVVGCDVTNANNQNTNTNNHITVSFSTSKGSLSFSSKTLDGNKLYKVDCPTVTYTGNDYIFDYWMDGNYQEFDFSTTLTSNITLYAHFDEAEYVCYDTWQADKSLCEYKGYGYAVSNITSRSTSSYLSYFGMKTIGKKLMAKSEILPEYITLTEFNRLSSKNVFTTTATEKSILRESDLTSNVYTVVNVASFENICYQMVDYAPAGKKPTHARISYIIILSEYLNKNVDTTKFDRGSGSGYRTNDSGKTHIYKSSDSSIAYQNMAKDNVLSYSTNYDDFTYGAGDTFYMFTSISSAYVYYSYTAESGLSTAEKYFYYTSNDVYYYLQYFYFDTTGETHFGISYDEYQALDNN